MNKKDIRGASLNARRNLLITLGVLAALLGAVLLGLFLSGFRCIRMKYQSVLDGAEQTVSFIGFVDREGKLKKGRLFYDARRAAVERNDDGLYVITFSNGDRYEGEMDGLQRQGEGKMVYAGGDTYEGGFANDRFHGYGVYQYAAGDRYEGSFSAGKKSGEGKYFWITGGEIVAQYEGGFLADRREGYGVYTAADGTVYAGNFSQDVKEDKQAEVLIPANGGGMDRYFGGYSKDVRSGFGYYFYATGNVYVGYFKNNKPDGEGTIYFVEGGSHSGTFVDGNLVENVTDVSKEEEEAFFASVDGKINPLTGQKRKIP